MRRINKIARRAVLPLLLIIVLAAAAVYLFHPSGQNAGTLSQSAAAGNFSGKKPLSSTAQTAKPAAGAHAVTGDGAVNSGAGTGSSQPASSSPIQMPASGVTSPPAAQPSPQPSPSPAQTPCYTCGGGRMCPLQEGAAANTCYPCGTYSNGSLIACRTE